MWMVIWIIKKKKYELVEYDCKDGKCLMLREETTDHKIGALSLDHQSVGEAIVDELNEQAEIINELVDYQNVLTSYKKSNKIS